MRNFPKNQSKIENIVRKETSPLQYKLSLEIEKSNPKNRSVLFAQLINVTQRKEKLQSTLLPPYTKNKRIDIELKIDG